MTTAVRDAPSPTAHYLGVGGLIPFVALSLAIWVAPPHYMAWAATALVGYSATILSFLGAIHWGLTMRESREPRPVLLTWGVLPSLVAWLGILLPASAALGLMTAMLWTCFAIDRQVYPQFGVQAWLPLRFLLTLVASLCCVVGAWGLTV